MGNTNYQKKIIKVAFVIVVLIVIDFFANTNFILKLIPSLSEVEYKIRGCAVEGQKLKNREQKCCPPLMGTTSGDDNFTNSIEGRTWTCIKFII